MEQNGLRRYARNPKPTRPFETKVLTGCSSGSRHQAASRTSRTDESDVSAPAVILATGEALRDDADYIREVMKPLSTPERVTFHGWIEVESDPTLFTTILQRFGVRHVRVQEVLGLEDFMLALVPHPVHGLIFLSKYRDDDVNTQGRADDCPKHVWFANQISPNLCATAALLNIVMNVPVLDLGEELSKFRTSTTGRTAIHRGQMLSQNAFIRQHHNSFARRMDFLQADMSMAKDSEAWERRKSRVRPTKQKPRNDADDTEGFHFVAYVPINDEVWRLDGLQSCPRSLGDSNGDWLTVARTDISRRVARYSDEDGLQFNLLALHGTTPTGLVERIHQHQNSSVGIENDHRYAGPEDRRVVPMPSTRNCANSEASIPEQKVDLMPSIDEAQLAGVTRDSGNDPNYRSGNGEIPDRRDRELKINEDEEEVIMLENQEAARRATDLTPMVYDAIKLLAEKGVLKELVAMMQDER